MTSAKTSPRLLVSVRSAHEAQAALAGGADIIDIKEPSRGPLGMADVAIIQQIVQVVGKQRPVTAALGELGDWDGNVPPTAGLWCVKIALAGQAATPWAAALTRVQQAVHPLGLVVAAYADAHRVQAPAVDDLLAWVIQHQAAGLLIDTAVKDGQGLFDHVTAAELTRWQQTCQEGRGDQENFRGGQGFRDFRGFRGSRGSRGGRGFRGWLALAGSLYGASFVQAVSLRPDVVAVRGAACQGRQRLQAVHAQQVRELANQLHGR